MERDKNNDFLDFEFNLGLVFFGKLSDLQRLNEIPAREKGRTIRYQTLDQGRLFTRREGGDL